MRRSALRCLLPLAVFRSCTPIAVSVSDYYFYKRAFPTPRSILSLLLITCGAIAYIVTDREFQVNGLGAYTWVLIWWVVLVFQLTCAPPASCEDSPDAHGTRKLPSSCSKTRCTHSLCAKSPTCPC
jgi:hypothetical protein